METGADYVSEYRVRLPDGTVRWIAARGRMHPDPHGKPTRMLGASIDITDRKQAELEIAQQRNELAHLSRVNMLGELAGSLAHELNQPLTAILSNAQAAQRFLSHDRADLNEVRDILTDIVAEDKRAGEVIHRLRLLLKKGEVQHQPLSVNQVIQEVLKLVRSDLVNQGFTARAELDPDLPAAPRRPRATPAGADQPGDERLRCDGRQPGGQPQAHYPHRAGRGRGHLCISG